jgi:glycosyltransferase 2 family protein
MKARITLLSLVGIILFIIILSRINLAELAAVFASASPAIFFLALLVNGVAVVLKSLKWKIIVNTVKRHFSLWASIRAFLVGFSFSTITPAKLGDFIKVFYVTDEECSMGKSLGTIVIDRLMDILLLLSVSLLGVTIFSFRYRIEILSTGVLLVVIVGVLALTYVVLNKKVLIWLLRPFFSRFVPESQKGTLSQYFDDFFAGLAIFYHDKPRFTWSIAVGIASWVPPILYGYLLALSLGIELNPSYFAFIIPVLALVDLLPISISGIGTRDVVLIFLFGLSGVPPEQAVAFSLLYLFTSYWLVALIGALVYLRYPIQIPEQLL